MFIFFSSFLFLFTLHQTISLATLKLYDYDIAEYTRALPSELKETVKTALLAERNVVHSKERSVEQKDCQKDENEEERISCPPSKYRTQTGMCNNIRHPKWGNRGVPFLRLLAPDYADGKL